MAAISNNVFIVFTEEAPLEMVMLLCISLVARKRLGKTSSATIASNTAMVTDELMKAYRHLPLFNCRGILAIAKNISNGKAKYSGLLRILSLKCGTYNKVYKVVIPNDTIKNTVKLFANKESLVYKRFSVFIAK